MIAGPNGCGKTTFAREYLPHEAGTVHFVNADLIASGLSPLRPALGALAAGRLVLAELDRLAGARQVILASSARWALMTELRGAPERPLSELLSHLDPVDLVIVEGYKRDAHPKVEAWRAETGQPLIAAEDPTVRAVASNDRPPAAHLAGRPVIGLDDIPAIADFILDDLGMAQRKIA